MKLTSMTDEYRFIDGFENYIISEYGKIIRLPYTDTSGKFRNGKEVTGKIDEAGYTHVCLRRNNKPYYKLVHRLVASAFIGYQENMQVNHLDGNKGNNHW